MKFAAWTMLAAMVTAAGCCLGGPSGAARAPKAPLALTLAVSNARPAIGEKVKVTLTAANTTREPITITAETAAPMALHVWRPIAQSWETFRQFPQAAQTRQKVWQLKPGQTVTHSLVLEITPDWPTVETLRVVGSLNGRPDVTAEALLRVQPRVPSGS